MAQRNKKIQIKEGVTRAFLSSIRRARKEKLTQEEKLIFALQDISRYLSSETDITGILTRMAETIGKTLEAKWVNFWDFTPDKQHVYIIAAYRMQEQYIEKLRTNPLKLGTAWIGRAMKTGKIWCTTDMLTDPFLPPQYLGIVKQQETRGLLCAPLLMKSEIVGGMCIYFSKPHHFSDFELRLVDVVVNQAATAVENTKIFRALFSEKRKTDAMVASLHDGLIVYDLEGKIIAFNRRAEELLWVRRAEVINKSAGDLNVEDNEFLRNIKEISSLSLVEFESREFSIDDPEKRVLRITFLPLRDENDQKVGYMRVLHDITSQKELEEMRTRFVSVASHQLRTPLSGFKWALDMLLREEFGKLTEEQKDVIKNCYARNENLIGLIRDLLDVSRIEEERFGYSFELVDTGKFISIVKQVAKEFSDEIARSRVNFSFQRLKETPGRVRIDQGKIKMAVQNIFDNAIKYTEPDGFIKASLDIGELSLVLTISDSGIGIPEDQKKYVFTKFFRARNAILMQVEGSGLGLWIANEIVRKHNGRILVETKENQGSSFSIQLPLEKEPETNPHT